MIPAGTLRHVPLFFREGSSGQFLDGLLYLEGRGVRLRQGALEPLRQLPGLVTCTETFGKGALFRCQCWRRKRTR